MFQVGKGTCMFWQVSEDAGGAGGLDMQTAFML